MLKKILSLSLVLLGTFVSLAQLELQTCITDSRNPWEWPGAKHWYVAEYPSVWTEKAYILDFNNSPFTVSRLGDGTTANGQYAFEGITAASNDNGELIYYTNGINAWNNAGTEVSNTLGEGSEGMRNTGSAAQGVISIRHPLTPKKYYAVATNDVIGPNLATSYNVFDETGTEIQSNTFLPGDVTVAEGISATLHANGVDIWLSAQGISSTLLHSWLLTCDGFITASVTSDVAKSATGDQARGGIAFSHDGKKLASVFPVGLRTNVCVYDFDNKTGKFSDRKDVGGGWGVTANGYDVVFSKDNSQLIVGSAKGNKSFRVDLSIEVLFNSIGVIPGFWTLVIEVSSPLILCTST